MHSNRCPSFPQEERKGEMKWQRDLSSEQPRLILWVKPPQQSEFIPYTAWPGSVPDHDIPHGSKGWSTYQHLFKQGWKLQPTQPQDR